MVETMTKQLGERMSILLARKSWKGAEKRKRSNYERPHNKQLFKKSWDWSGGKIRRLELGKTICSKPVETTDVSDIPIRVRTVDARSYRKWLKTPTPTITSREKILDKLRKRDRMSPKVTNVTRVSVLENDVDEAAAENLSPNSIKRQRLDFGSEQRRYFPSAEPSLDTHGSSISKNGRGSISRPEVEISEADNRNDWAERVHVKTKIDDEHNACAGCTLGGKLLCCAGRECKRRYHPSCLDPPFNTTPPGVWHCLDCVKKKIKSGVHSVSKGVESICDVREVVSDHEEMQKQKEYLVKYQGLAHFHNQWIPEMVLPLEAAKLVAKFNGGNQVKKWRKEWTVPERLIHKRRLPSEECYNINSDCHCSWLVKWTGLGYDHATWELEGSSLLTSRQAMKLIKDYESRHETAEGISSFSQADKGRKDDISSLSELSFGDSTRVKHCYLSYVNKLRKYWHKGQNAIIVDDQVDKERVVKVIFFILSLQQVVRKPFLIVSTPHALSVWEAELLHVAPSTNFIVYKGGKDTRASIRSLEFYNKIGQILFQVLLCTPNIVFEDLDVLKCIQWEAIIVDECQESGSTRYFKKFKMLDAGMRLLVSSHIKDCSSDYLIMLSLLDSGLDGLGSGKTEVQPMSINKLKERLASYTAYDCKSSVIRFVEYWVPVRLSNVQLEQYCAILLSNSRLLCSSLKTDSASILREVIISTRKCCDHPYLLDRSLRSMLQNGRTIEECLDAEIQVSGKLLLLEKMLLEIRSRNLRAMVIFQPIGGSGLDSAGDILEDFLCQKFGHNCYIRIDGNSGLYAHSKKQAALNTFNAKKSENFVFLIENRACLSSIKLSLVDVVILFDSDLDPQNDLRALHRVSITSRSEELRVFRLYSCCTIEEKSLILAKEGAPIENSIASLSRSVSHALLSWGASHLFRKLDDLHGCMASVPGSTIFSDQSFLDDVLLEFSAELPLSSEANNPNSYSFISKVEQNVRGYKAHALLAGEKEALAINGGKPGFLLWKKLLERKQYKWLFLSDSSSKIRRKVKCADDSLKESEFGYSEGRKKSQKVVNERIDHLVLKSRLKHTRKPSTDRKGGSRRSNFKAARSATSDSGRVLESEVRSMPQSTQKISLLLPKIFLLSDVLKLSEDTKNIIGFFLEYLDKDYNYGWKTNSSLQAFQISVCWLAVSFLKQEIDHKESLAIAKLQLDFICEEGEANYIYSELWNLEEGFKCYLKNVEPADLEVGEMMTRADEAKISERTACYQQDLEEGEAQLSSNNSRKSKSAPSDQAGRDLQRCFESRCLSDQLAGLEDAERPMSSNCAMNSRSNTLCGKYLEEEVMSMSSNCGKRSKRSISVEQECEGELPNSSANQILSAQLMTSEDGVTPVRTSDAIANYSKVASCDWQDQEEGEIPLDSNGTNNSKMVTPVLQDLEEGEIPIGSERHSISDRAVNSEEGEIAISLQIFQNCGKRSKRSISVEQECEGELPNSSANQILSAQLMTSEDGVTPVRTSDAIANYSKVASCDWQDQEEGEIPLDSNGTNNSKMVTLVLQDLEEGEIPIGSERHSISDRVVNSEEGEIAISFQIFQNCGKRSKRSISVEQECEGQLPNSSANQILSAQLMTSEDGVTPVRTSDAIANYSKVASCDWQDQEEGEIPLDSNGTNNSKMVTPVLQDLEEGEIPIGSERHSISDRVVNSEEGEIAISFQSAGTLEQELGSTTLGGSFKVKMDDSSCQIELHGKNLKTLESAPRIVEEQLEAIITLQLKKTLDKPIASLESLHLSDTELKVDDMLSSEAKGVHIDSKDASLTFSSPTNQNHYVTLPTMPSAIPVIAPHAKEFCKLISGAETIIVESDTECKTMEATIAKKVADSCSNQIGEVSSSTLGPELGFPPPVSVVKQSPAESVHIAETIIVGSNTDCDTMEATITKKVADSCSKKTGEVSSSTLGPEHGFPPPVPVVKQSPAENEHIAETIIVGSNTDCDTMEATITKKVADSCSKKTGEVSSSTLGPEHGFPPPVPVVKQSPAENEHIAETIIVGSNTDCDTMEETITKKVADSCSKKTGEVSSSTLGPEHGFPPPVPVVRQSPAENEHIAETIIVGSNTECDTMEATITKKVADSCSKKTGEVSSSTLGPELGFPPPVPVVKQSPAENEHIAETIIVGSNTECDTMEATITKNVADSCSNKTGEVSSSTLGPEHCFPASVPVVTQSPVENVHIIESSMKHSGALQTQPNEVAFVDDTNDQQAPPDEVVFIGNDIMPTQNKPMTLQRASISDAAQDSRTVTPIDHESHSLECTVTRSSLVHQDMSAVQGESCPVQQLPISTVPFTAEQRSPVEPQFIGGQGYQSGQMQSSCQETQIPRHLSFEDSTESCSPCTAHIPLQPVTSIHEGGNETFVQDARSRINVQDFWNAANRLRSPNDHLFDSPVRPEIPEHTSLDPLLIEMQRIANDAEKDDKAHQDMVLRLTSERDEEMRKVLQKYGPLIQAAEIARQQRKKEHRANLLKVYAHKFLAQVMTMKANDHMEDLAQGKGKASVPSVHRLIQLSAQQNAQMPVSGHEQHQPGPPMAPPAEVISRRSSVCAPTIHARPCSSPRTYVARNLQNGNEQNEQMAALRHEQYQSSPLMAPLAEVMSSHSSACAPAIHARSSPITSVPRNLQNGNEQNAQMPALRREQYQANLLMTPPAELMSHPSVYAPAIHGSPTMTCMPRNLQIGNELRALSPSPAPHLLQAFFRSHSSALAPNHPVINNWDT